MNLIISFANHRRVYLFFWLICVGVLLSCFSISRAIPTIESDPVGPLPIATSTSAPEDTPTVMVTPSLGFHSIWRNSRIAFASNRSGKYQIYLMKPDGSDITQLTDSVGDNLSPAWSLDANHIAFVSTRDGNSEIYLMDSDGSNQKNLSHDLSNDYSPIWLPKDELAFISNRKGRERIFVMNVDGNGIQSFGETSIDSTSKIVCLTWLSEGLISSSVQGNGMMKVYIVDITNGDVWRPDIFNGAHQRSCPEVAKLVMDRWDIYVDIQNNNFEIYKYDEKSDLDVPLINTGSLNLGPSRSADEDWLTFYSKRTGNWDVFMTEITGGNQWNITRDPADDIQPAWEPY